MAKRQTPEINAGSMADIAFLLLIFFLVTTTMDVDTGISRKLPPPPTGEENESDINQRNIFTILINSRDKLLVENKPGNIQMLRGMTKEFMTNPQNREDLPEMTMKNIEGIGNVRVPAKSAVISLKNDRGTSYKMYIAVQNELTAAVNELRNDLSMQKFGKKYSELDEAKSKAIQKALPVPISEAEPEDIGGK